MARPNTTLSMKRIGVDKTNARIIAITAVAAFLVVFFLVASYSLFGQLAFQNRIIGAKKAAVKQLKANLTARDSLVKSYTAFAESPNNFIGGTATGTGEHDSSNSKLVLDALPGKYDYPALATSLEKISNDQKVGMESLTGTDDEISQSAEKSVDTQPIEMPFQIKVSGDYGNIQRTVDAFDHSIRPIQLQKLEITGEPSKINLDITAVSYYQPAKILKVNTKVIK